MLPPWHPHVDVWVILGAVGFSYWYLNVRIRPHLSPSPPSPRPRHWTSFYIGLGLIWIVSEWPLHDLAEKSLYWVHMVDHTIITLAGPPLMLLAFNRQMADHLFGSRRIRPWLRHLAHPAAAFAIFNLGMLITHWPEVVALSLRSEVAHFLIHLFLFGSAILMWIPVALATTVLPRLRPPMQILYLFLNSILPTIPASFLTLSTVPLYPAYGDSSLAFGLTPVMDQTLAGAIMKISGTMLFWVIMAVIWFRWSASERRWDQIEQELSASP